MTGRLVHTADFVCPLGVFAARHQKCNILPQKRWKSDDFVSFFAKTTPVFSTYPQGYPQRRVCGRDNPYGKIAFFWSFLPRFFVTKKGFRTYERPWKHVLLSRCFRRFATCSVKRPSVIFSHAILPSSKASTDVRKGALTRPSARGLFLADGDLRFLGERLSVCSVWARTVLSLWLKLRSSLRTTKLFAKNFAFG